MKQIDGPDNARNESAMRLFVMLLLLLQPRMIICQARQQHPTTVNSDHILRIPIDEETRIGWTKNKFRHYSVITALDPFDRSISPRPFSLLLRIVAGYFYMCVTTYYFCQKSTTFAQKCPKVLLLPKSAHNPSALHQDHWSLYSQLT